MGIASGGVIAPLVNAGTKYIHPWGWRLSYAIALIPALMLMLGGFILPDTPNSLVLRGKDTEVIISEQQCSCAHRDAIRPSGIDKQAYPVNIRAAWPGQFSFPDFI